MNEIEKSGKIENKKVIGLITDFGIRGSHYVGAMKTVIYKICPNAKIVDINHNIKPFSIVEANFVIYYALRDLPKESILVAVIDPGVGTSREIIAATTSKNVTVIGPNNGIFTLASEKFPFSEIYSIENRALFYNRKGVVGNTSSTFHGRDIMSPTAAHLYSGIDINRVGKRFDSRNLIKIEDLILNASNEDKTIDFTILYEDQFGNLITNIEPEIFHQYEQKKATLKHNDDIPIQKYNNFAEIPENTIGLIKGSSEFIEICKKNDSAAKFLKLTSGARLSISFS